MKNLKKQNENLKKNRPADRLQLLRHTGKVRLLKLTLAGKVINNEDLLSGTSIIERVYPIVITCSNYCCLVIYDMVILINILFHSQINFFFFRY